MHADVNLKYVSNFVAEMYHVSSEHGADIISINTSAHRTLNKREKKKMHNNIYQLVCINKKNDRKKLPLKSDIDQRYALGRPAQSIEAISSALVSIKPASTKWYERDHMRDATCSRGSVNI